MINKIKNSLVMVKIYISRTMSYVSIINAGMIFYIFIKGTNLNINMKIWFVPLILVGTFLLIFIGYIEDKLGFFKLEIELRQKRNPQITEILKEVKKNK